MRSYLLLLSRPRARPMVVAAAVTRLGSPMLTLSLLLAVHAARGSFAAGGVALAAHAVALAAGAPVGGRLADRYQPGPLLLGALALHLAMYGLLITALVHPDVPMPVLVAVAALLGFTTPPASAVTRGVWPALVESDQLHTAYALDTVLNEAAFVVGPLIVTGLVVFLAPATVVAISGGFVLVGVLLLVWVTPAHLGGSRSGGSSRSVRPLADRRIRALLGSMALGTFSYGGMLIAIAARATQSGSTDLTGLITGGLSAGTLIGGLAYGAVTIGHASRRQLLVSCLAAGGVLALAAAAPALPLLGVLIFLTGAITAPRDVLNQQILGEMSDPAHRTEAFAWVNTFMWGGYAVGTSVTGYVVSGASPGVALLACGALECVAGIAVYAALGRTPAERVAQRAQERLESEPQPGSSHVTDVD